jgi:hypothetical protein
MSITIAPDSFHLLPTELVNKGAQRRDGLETAIARQSLADWAYDKLVEHIGMNSGPSQRGRLLKCAQPLSPRIPVPLMVRPQTQVRPPQAHWISRQSLFKRHTQRAAVFQEDSPGHGLRKRLAQLLPHLVLQHHGPLNLSVVLCPAADFDDRGEGIRASSRVEQKDDHAPPALQHKAQRPRAWSTWPEVRPVSKSRSDKPVNHEPLSPRC